MYRWRTGQPPAVDCRCSGGKSDLRGLSGRAARDMVIYSGAKAFNAPTSGFITGRTVIAA
ncbi:hypothetical protein KCP73_12835 [Salmonella enterica subsp. enterica]|nr:hypothetical protein KCP73_12835 [Salmonella enterica subsp. enterica]